MAKKKKKSIEEEQRQSRKEVLIARRQAEQTRQIRLAIFGIVGLLAVVLVIGLVNELVLKPSSPVAEVNGVEIAMRDWQQRVRLQRAQLILSIEDLYEAVGRDVGQVQQLAGQQMNLLQDSTTLGQIVLDQTINEELIRQEAETRGIVVSDVDVQREIEESFNYFGGASPTAFPTPTETIMPTPSLTPLPTPVITEVLPTSTPFPTPTDGPTSTPFPTATPVSLEAFAVEFGNTIDRFRELGTPEEAFRELIRAQLLEERLGEALADEAELAEEEEQVSFLYIAYASEDEAGAALEEIESSDYLSVWNTVRSRPFDPEAPNPPVASELLWRGGDDIEGLFGAELSQFAFQSPLEESSGIIVVASDTEDGEDQYYIIYVTGREIRPLTESELRNARQQVLTNWLDSQRINTEVFERWRANAPVRPILNPDFLVPPTPAPATPSPELTIPAE
jgi:parvulin-like peptidyl-prolyl isomerase